MSPAVRTVGPMTNQVQITVAHDVLDEPCPRCESTAVRVVVSSSVDVVIEADAAADPFAGESPLFDCRECGFEWGELVRDLMR
jgi:hypothetical protein